MTIPHMTNCAHQGDGWCLDCVRKLFEDKERLAHLIDAWVAWEADVLMNPDCWPDDEAGFTVYDEVYDRYGELQRLRHNALKENIP